MNRGASVANPNITLLQTLSVHEKHVMLCYIAGFATDVFQYGVRAMLAEQGDLTETEHAHLVTALHEALNRRAD